MIRLAPLLSLLACATVPLPVPTPAQVAAQQSRTPEATLETLTAGRDVVIRTCGRCHAPPKPWKESVAEWVDVVDEMAPKAKLDDAETQWVLQYLQATAELPPAHGPS